MDIGDQLPERRIGELLPEGQRLDSVLPDESLKRATSIMSDKNYSQLPVISDGGELEGIITWESIGKSLEDDATREHVRDCMDTREKIIKACSDDDLLDSTKDIAESGYVLVMEDDGTVKGIVTASDLAVEFRKLGEGFLLIEEIEGHLGEIIDSKFTHEEKVNARGRCHCGRVTLTLGNYHQLLKIPDHWNRLGLDTCKKCFMSYLESVRDIRNRQMHFDSRELEPEDLEKLHGFRDLLRGLGRA